MNYTQRQILAQFKYNFELRKNKLEDNRFICNWKDIHPCLNDATATTTFDAHYLYHTAWAARILAQAAPQKHVDIGSCLRFVSIVSAIIPTAFYDYRPAQIALSNLTCGQADLLRLHFTNDSIPSLSCMHVVEHIGLERYGDPFDPKGDIKAMHELSRVLAPKGTLLFVVPIGGTAKIQYNAHRIYTPKLILDSFPALTCVEFSLITDSGQFIENAKYEDALTQTYGCGCFLFQKHE